MEGFVSWVGRSSIEASIRVLQETEPNSPKWHTVIDAKFVMVAKHPITAASTPVCPLEFDDAEEKKIFQHGEGILLIFFVMKKK